MASSLNEDVVAEVLEQLWVLHTTSWDSEFRPEASRRFFSNYSRVSKVWTLPAQRYVYRYAYLRWNADFIAFEAGLKNPQRGKVLKESVRVLYLYISHSAMGISIQKLDRILALCPNLVELQLSTGPEINSLFLRPSQESRLRSYFLAVRPTLRALQVRFDGRCKKNRILKQLGELVPFSTLDLLSIASDDCEVKFPRLNPTLWDVRTMGHTSVEWPLETNAHTISLRSVLAPSTEDEPTPCPIYPHTLRFNATEVCPWGIPHSYLELLGSRLKRVMCQTIFDQGKWSNDCEVVVGNCPELEQLILFDCHLNAPQKRTATRLYVLEPQDWHTTTEEQIEAPSPTDEKSPNSAEKTLESGTRVLALGDKVSTASHIVGFVERISKTWLKERNTIMFRKEPVFEPRWLQEALTGRTEPRSASDLRYSYGGRWADTIIERHGQYMIALRRPSTLSASDIES